MAGALSRPFFSSLLISQYPIQNLYCFLFTVDALVFLALRRELQQSVS